MRMRTMLKRKIKLICNLSTRWDGVGMHVCAGCWGEGGWTARGLAVSSLVLEPLLLSLRSHSCLHIPGPVPPAMGTLSVHRRH